MPRPSVKKKTLRQVDAAWDALDAGNGKKALREIDKAIEFAHESRSANCWAVKSRILHELEDHRAAEDAAWNSLRLDEMCFRAWMSLGLISSDEHQFMKAAFCYKKAVEIEEDFGTYTMLAAVEEMFDPESAIKHAKKALELNPDWDEAEKILEGAKESLKEE